MINNTIVTQRGMKATFNQARQAVNPIWRRLCMQLTSDGASENYGWLGALPVVREWIGDRLFKGLDDYEFTLRNKAWELSMGIDRDHLEDDQYGMINQRLTIAGQRFERHPNKLLADLLNNGHAGTLGLAYDGQYFFDTDHPTGSSTQSNDLTGSIVDKDDPTSAEFKAAFLECALAITGFTDDQGEPVNETDADGGMSGLVAVVPSSMYEAANEALKSVLIGNTSNVIVNMADVVMFNRLTETDVFFVLKVDEPVGPFVHQMRREVVTEIKDDREDKYVKFMADARYNMGYGLPQMACRYEFTTAT